MLRFCFCYVLISLVISMTAVRGEEQRWGDLAGQLIYDGKPPERKKIDVKAGYPETLDESQVVDLETHGLANVFVYLRPAKNLAAPLQVHPDYGEQIKQLIEWTIDDRGYSPHVILIHTNQPVLFLARGKEALACKSEMFRNGASSLLLPPKREYTQAFANPEGLPATFGCLIRPWFSGYALIRDNPYMTTTDTSGRFTIKNLPLGEHEFQFWQEKTGYVNLPEVQLHEVNLTGNLEKGRLVFSIQEGENNLGTIKLQPQQFEPKIRKPKP